MKLLLMRLMMKKLVPMQSMMVIKSTMSSIKPDQKELVCLYRFLNQSGNSSICMAYIIHCFMSIVQKQQRKDYFFEIFLIFLFWLQLVHFSDKFIQILEMTVDRGEPDVGNLVQPVEFFQHQFSQLRGGNFAGGTATDKDGVFNF